jgi:hypothetical protein
MPDTQITLVEADAGAPNDPQCGIENIYDRVVENRSGWFWRKPFHSAVFVWGEIYDQGDGFILQSHMRVFWNGRADRELEVSVDAPELVRPLRFAGDLPSDTISFPARKISMAEQQQLATAVSARLQVRAAPRADAAPAFLPNRFMAAEYKRPWLELQGRDLKSVWLLIDEDGLDAAPVLPETLFARAMASYLNFRVGREEGGRQQVMAALARFRQAMGHADEPLSRVPLAVADVIEGTLGLPTTPYVAPSPSPDASSDLARSPQVAAAVQFESTALQTATPADSQTVSAASQNALDEAVRRLPSSGEVLNLAAIARIPGCCHGAGAQQRMLRIQKMLERAQALENGNLKIARNLMNWYAYLATFPDGALPYPRAELAERRQKAALLLSAWSALPY